MRYACCKSVENRWHLNCVPGFLLERNMHFVVANIVVPLTQSKGVSFVTLWGGRKVDYFVRLGRICGPLLFRKLALNCFTSRISVYSLYNSCCPSLPCLVRSHSWGTTFTHFVHSIRSHALAKEGIASWADTAYWICSFAPWQTQTYFACFNDSDSVSLDGRRDVVG